MQIDCNPDGSLIQNHIYYCSFCGKNSTEVTTLVAGPLVFICDECSDEVAIIVNRIRKTNADHRAWVDYIMSLGRV